MNDKLTAIPKLTMKQELFCHEYIKDFNLTQAAIRAGYSKKSARQIATATLSNASVQQFMNQLTKKIIDKAEADSDKLGEELNRLVFSDMKDFVSWDKDGDVTFKPSDEVDGRIVSEISSQKTTTTQGDIVTERVNFKFKLHSKLTAMDLLAKIKKLYAETQVTNNTQIVILREFE